MSLNITVYRICIIVRAIIFWELFISHKQRCYKTDFSLVFCFWKQYSIIAHACPMIVVALMNKSNG